MALGDLIVGRVRADSKTEVITTGGQHEASSRDGRAAHRDGGLVDNVTSYPAYRNAVRSICGLYDFQSEDRLTGGLLALFH